MQRIYHAHHSCRSDRFRSQRPMIIIILSMQWPASGYLMGTDFVSSRMISSLNCFCIAFFVLIWQLFLRGLLPPFCVLPYISHKFSYSHYALLSSTFSSPLPSPSLSIIFIMCDVWSCIQNIQVKHQLTVIALVITLQWQSLFNFSLCWVPLVTRWPRTQQAHEY